MTVYRDRTVCRIHQPHLTATTTQFTPDPLLPVSPVHISSSAAFDQSPIVLTVYTTSDPKIRATNPRFCHQGNYVANIPNSKEVFSTERSVLQQSFCECILCSGSC